MAQNATKLERKLEQNTKISRLHFFRVQYLEKAAATAFSLQVFSISSISIVHQMKAVIAAF